MKKRQSYLPYLDRALTVLVILLLGLTKPDIVLIATTVLIVPYLYLTKRKNSVQHFLLAGIVALTWMIIAQNEYQYNQKMILLFGLNTYPLFAWTAGLFTAYMIYAQIEAKIQYKSNLKKMLLFVALYWPLLLAVETIAYHWFNIVNVATQSYPGLPLCDCIHTSWWMKTVYFALGPIYFGLCEYLGLENPHKK